MERHRNKLETKSLGCNSFYDLIHGTCKLIQYELAYYGVSDLHKSLKHTDDADLALG